jgi:putative ABC transport system substrate-binding protein
VERRAFVAGTLGLLAAPLAAKAQLAGKVYRIGILPPGPIAPRMHLWKAFQDELRQLGYVEGQNITFVIRSPEEAGKPLAELAAELVSLRVDVIVTAGPGTLAAKNATSTLPVVFTNHSDPVSVGVVASLARPGGNVTGVSLMAPELGGKRLQLLKEVVPRASRVAILWNPANPVLALLVRETEAAARTLGVPLQHLEIRAPEDIDHAFEAATRGLVSALTVVEDPLVLSQRARVVALAAESRLPAIYGFREVAEAGGLMSYAANLSDSYRRAATYVDKILKGAKPADLPVEQPTKFELVINLKTAKALGLTIPPSVLARADEVIP